MPKFWSIRLRDDRQVLLATSEAYFGGKLVVQLATAKTWIDKFFTYYSNLPENMRKQFEENVSEILWENIIVVRKILWKFEGQHHHHHWTILEIRVNNCQHISFLGQKKTGGLSLPTIQSSLPHGELKTGLFLLGRAISLMGHPRQEVVITIDNTV